VTGDGDAAVRAAVQTLAIAGVASPRHDAEVLAAQVLGVPPGQLARAAGFSIPAERRFAELVARRATRVPLQYLTGTVGFRRIDLAVGPGVFIPRPETEALVGWCVRELGAHPAPRIVDLCAGSGAIALALAHELPAAQVHAVEREPAALHWLCRNTAGSAVRCWPGDAATAGPDGPVDLVVANPPYLSHADLAIVEPEVSEHEPAAALWADEDGRAGVRMVARRAWELLSGGGLVAVEHGDTQGPAAVELLAGLGFLDPADHSDLTGRPRFATGRRPT